MITGSLLGLVAFMAVIVTTNWNNTTAAQWSVAGGTALLAIATFLTLLYSFTKTGKWRKKILLKSAWRTFKYLF